MSDDPGVMSNLPRSRPGRRSEKRSSGAKGGGSAAPGGSKAARASSSRAGGAARAGAKQRARAGSSSAGARKRPPAARRPSQGPDPVGDAVRLGAKLAGAGLGIAAGVLRRLPRP